MRRFSLSLGTILIALVGWSQAALAQDYWVETCQVDVVNGHPVVHVRACRNSNGANQSARVDFWYNLTSPPPTSNAPQGDLTWNWSSGSSGCRNFDHSDPLTTVPNGKYHAYCQINSTANPVQQLAVSDVEWVSGPDLIVWRCSASKEGATIKYKGIVCNIGTDVARNFRVGFFYDHAYPPRDGEYSDHFKSVTELQFTPPDVWWWSVGCKEIKHERHNTPDGYYRSWVKADSGGFVLEGIESNNTCGPMYINMANPNLVVTQFDATVGEQKPYVVRYHIEVCNKGAATARVFWIDIYYDRDIQDPPQLGEPGEVHERIDNLTSGSCVERWYEMSPPDPGDGTIILNSWAQADSDEFTSDPDRSDNLEGPLEIHVPGGVLPAGCVDNDQDGFGFGVTCEGKQDCDDDDPSVHPDAGETCGDQLDNNCDGNIDEGCPGVDCQDRDGDGSPSGRDCQTPDCDDQDPQRSPLLDEACGDGIDNDCDGITDDCCPGTDCCDADNDGYGVGTGCEGPQDCNDSNPQAGLGGEEEICGNGTDDDCDGIVDDCCEGVLCCDADNDGYGVGIGCEGPQDPDDGDPDVHPGGDDICGNAIDDNGNGVVDEGCDNECLDTDGDGYCVGDGDCSQTNPQCVDRPKDCNDQDNAVHPGAQESCNGRDDNCNGTIDDHASSQEACADPNCIMACARADCVQNCAVPDDACLYECGRRNQSCSSACSSVDCVDLDGDGWGSGPGCAWEDCDDSDQSVHPEAQEVCGNTKDENCNGSLDDSGPNGPACLDPDCVRACADSNCANSCGGDQGCIYNCGIQNQSCANACNPVDCIDRDGDGWPSGDDCNGPTDQDDTDPSKHPHAKDICGDGLDQDGDGVADDGCLLCVDLDQDGYGTGIHCLERDCNEFNANIHPHARERCGEGDRNCDGKVVSKERCPACATTSGSSDPSSFLLFGLLGLWLGGRLRRKRRKSKESQLLQ